MSGFFRENNSLAFKNRSNIFAAKLRPVAVNDESAEFDSSGIIDDAFYGEIDKNKKSDDLEITEVRLLDGESTVVTDRSSHEAVDPKNNNASGEQEENMGSATQQNSNDVLLEAFTNTQRICSSLKQQLAQSQKENLSLNRQITDYETKTKSINNKIGEYKKLLESLKDNLNDVIEMKKSQEKTIDENKTVQEGINQKLRTLQKEIENVGDKLKKSNEIARAYEGEVNSKKNEIDYLKRQLDEAEGLLSEEKIKNNKLFTTFKEEKESILSYWNKNLGNQQAYINELLQTLQNEVISVLIKNNQGTNASLITELKDYFQIQISSSITEYVRKFYYIYIYFLFVTVILTTYNNME